MNFTLKIMVLVLFCTCFNSYSADDKYSHTFMHQEAESTAEIVSKQYVKNKEKIIDISKAINAFNPKYVVSFARGSSKNAALYAEYLFAKQLNLHAFAAKLSDISIENINKDFSEILVLAISQSGKSQDILDNVIAAKSQGAFILAIVNDIESPLAKLADAVLPTYAGIEKSVAATKTFTLTLTAVAQLIFTIADNKQMLTILETLSEELKKTWKLNWQQAIADFDLEHSVYIISRGIGLAIAKEAALKLKETCGIHAEAFSAAEVKHGPMRLFDNFIRVLAFAPKDNSLSSVIDVLELAKNKNLNAHLVSQYNHQYNLPYNTTLPSELEPIIMIHAFYRFVNMLSISLKQNPDQPPMLSKVTSTL